MHLQGELSYQLLEPGIVPFDLMHLTAAGIPHHLPGETLLTGLHKVLQPGIVSTRMNALPPTEIPYGGVKAQAFQDNGDLFFCTEFAAGGAFDILNEFFGLFTPGFCLQTCRAVILYGLPIRRYARRAFQTISFAK